MQLKNLRVWYRVAKVRRHPQYYYTHCIVIYLFIHSHTALLVLHQLAKEVNGNKGLGMNQPTRGGCAMCSYQCTSQRDSQNTDLPTVSAHAVAYITNIEPLRWGLEWEGDNPEI